MNVIDACDFLNDELASGHDPIVWRGKEMTPVDLIYKSIENDDATKTRISYHASGNMGKLKFVRNGTLSGMVKDRQKPRYYPPAKKVKPRKRCGNCGAFI